MNREWPYCDIFEFIKFKKVLRAKNRLTIQMFTQGLRPWVSPGKIVQFNYDQRNRPESFKYGDIVAYWDSKKVCAGIYLKCNGDEPQIIQRGKSSKLAKSAYLLARIPGLRLPLYRRLLIRLKGPSGLGQDPLLPRAPEDNIQKNSAN